MKFICLCERFCVDVSHSTYSSSSHHWSPVYSKRSSGFFKMRCKETCRVIYYIDYRCRIKMKNEVLVMRLVNAVPSCRLNARVWSHKVKLFLLARINLQVKIPTVKLASCIRRYVDESDDVEALEDMIEDLPWGGVVQVLLCATLQRLEAVKFFEPWCLKAAGSCRSRAPPSNTSGATRHLWPAWASPGFTICHSNWGWN